ncbi:FAD binding domain-containing protein [Phytohabitans suffuscus]|uniref:Carbon-monoxide dehydrogenase medium subunit n=1 Tax=Phytohabitans suffuscus TaxID=624315 RepID=A0A6F8Z0J8_9ACTN|nr:xanthine dehydrogenase family protein subunit M [Phytohabitans suffuscus]BCB91872.1 carbon-monoxide dehydrogenase medium subunit [Phytohabitans suffuscus]
MIPARFDYLRPDGVDEAVALLGPGTRVLAGGHSLIPALKLRQTTAARLVDVGRLAALRTVELDAGVLVIGAAVTYAELAAHPLVRRHCPVLARLGGRVADPQVRHRGTPAGALAHADPAGDAPAIALALGVEVAVRSAAGSRTVPAGALFTGRRETSLRAGDLVTAIRVPAHDAAWYEKFTRVSHMWAIAGACAVRGPSGVRVALANVAATPWRATGVEGALRDGATPAEAAALAADGTDPPDDVHGPAAYRRHLARVVTGRALARVTP